MKVLDGKKLGKKVILKVDGEKKPYSKTFESKEDQEKVLAKIVEFNKLVKGRKTKKEFLEKKQKEIIKLMTLNATKQKEELEKKEVAAKALKKRVAKEAKNEVKEEAAKKNLIEELADKIQSGTITDEELVGAYDLVNSLQQLLAKAKKVEEPKAQQTTTNYAREAYR